MAKFSSEFCAIANKHSIVRLQINKITHIVDFSLLSRTMAWFSTYHNTAFKSKIHRGCWFSHLWISTLMSQQNLVFHLHAEFVCLSDWLPACRICYTHWRCAVVWRVFYHFPSAIFLTFFIVNIFKCNLNRRYIISWIFELIALRSVLKVIFKCTNLLKVKNFIRLCARIFFKWFSHKNCYQCLILML